MLESRRRFTAAGANIPERMSIDATQYRKRESSTAYPKLMAMLITPRCRIPDTLPDLHAHGHEVGR